VFKWAKIIAGVVELFAALAKWVEREQAKADGAAIQRDADTRVDNEKIAKADIAGDAVASGGGVPVEQDEFNRDNR
jgi:hypothetical protein